MHGGKEETGLQLDQLAGCCVHRAGGLAAACQGASVSANCNDEVNERSRGGEACVKTIALASSLMLIMKGASSIVRCIHP